MMVFDPHFLLVMVIRLGVWSGVFSPEVEGEMLSSVKQPRGK